MNKFIFKFTVLGRKLPFNKWGNYGKLKAEMAIKSERTTKEYPLTSANFLCVFTLFFTNIVHVSSYQHTILWSSHFCKNLYTKSYFRYTKLTIHKQKHIFSKYIVKILLLMNSTLYMSQAHYNTDIYSVTLHKKIHNWVK